MVKLLCKKYGEPSGLEFKVDNAVFFFAYFFVVDLSSEGILLLAHKKIGMRFNLLMN